MLGRVANLGPSKTMSLAKFCCPISWVLLSHFQWLLYVCLAVISSQSCLASRFSARPRKSQSSDLVVCLNMITNILMS